MSYRDNTVETLPQCIFFYGTLLHPKVLKRVIDNDGNHLSVASAVLMEHTRHRIEGEDYPGVLPYSTSRQLFNRELSIEERSVLGTLVYGLNQADMRLLDEFEGDEYVRGSIHVHPVHPPAPLNTHWVDAVPTLSPTIHLGSLLPAVSAYIYIWANSADRVVPELWSYENFMKDNAWKWTGDDALDADTTKATWTQSSCESTDCEVDRRRHVFGSKRSVNYGLGQIA